MKKNLVAGILICFSLTVTAQSRWTLKQCIEYAIAHNIDILQTANTAMQSEVEVNTAKWARLPNLTGSASQYWNWGRTQSAVVDSETGNYSIEYVNSQNNATSMSISTTVPLFTGMQIPHQHALAKLNLKAAIADLQQAKDDIAINVASAYLQVLYDWEIYQVSLNQTDVSKEQYERINRLYQLGKASQAEVAQAKSDMAQDELSAVQSENDYRLALLDLSQLIELDTPEGFELETPTEAPDIKPLTPPDDIYQSAIIDKASIQAAQYRLEGSLHSIRVAQSAYYPQLSLYGSLSTNYYSSLSSGFGQQLSDNFNKYIGFNLSITLFNRLSTRNQVRTARLQQEYYALQLDNTKKALYKEIQQAWYNALAAESKYHSSVAATEAGEESFRLMKEKYENGKATAVEFSEAKQQLLQAQSNELQAKYDYLFRTKILDFYKGVPIE